MVALICVGLGFLVWPAWKIFMLFNLVAVGAVLVTVGYHRREGVDPISRTDLIRVSATHAGAAGTGVVAVSMLGTVAGALAWPLLLLAAVTSPWTLAFVARRTGAARHPTGTVVALADAPSPDVHTDVGPLPSLVLPSAVDALSDQELCRVWRASFSALQSARTSVARMQMVRLRQASLDELERRNPPALGAWLARDHEPPAGRTST